MKITKILLGVSLIASSIFADNIQVQHKDLSACGSDFYIGNRLIASKGTILNLQEMKDLNLKEVSPNKRMGSFKSYSFFANGFIYDRKVFKFEKDWSKNFLDALKEEYRFQVVCGVPTDKTTLINSIEDANMMAEWNQISLTSNLQKEMEKWVVANAKEIVLNNSLGGIEIGNNPIFMVADVTSIEEYKQKTLLIQEANERLYNQVIETLKSDEIARQKALAKGEISITHIQDFIWNKYPFLDKIEKEVGK